MQPLEKNESLCGTPCITALSKRSVDHGGVLTYGERVQFNLRKFIALAFCSVLFTTVSSFSAGEPVFEYSFGRPLQTAPSVDLDGTIYVGGAGAVAALTAAGVEKWEVELSPGSQAAIGGVTVADDRIYVTSAEGVFAFDKTGARLWTNNFNTYNSRVALGGSDTLYFLDTAAVLHATRSDGTERWTRPAQSTLPSALLRDLGPVVGLDGTVFTSAGTLIAFSPNGDRLWSAEDNSVQVSPVVNDDGSIYFSSSATTLGFVLRRFTENGTSLGMSAFFSAGSSAQAIIGPDRSLYVPTSRTSSNERGLIAYADGGQVKWRYDALDFKVSPVLASDGTLYAASSDGILVALNSSTGIELWRHTNQVPVAKAVTLGQDGSVLLAQTNGTLIAISGTSPVADRIWPVYGRDSRQTFQQRVSPAFSSVRAEGIGTNTATLRVALNPANAATAVFFEYSTSGSLSRTALQTVAATNGTVHLSQAISDLQPGTLYSLQAVSSNAFGVTRSESTSFRTLGESEEVPPLLSSLQAVASAGGMLKFSGPGTITIQSPIEFTTNAVVDGNGHQVLLSGGGVSSLLRVAPGVQLTLRRLWLVDGRAASVAGNSTAISKGGAVENAGGDLTIVGCVFSNNVSFVTTPVPPGTAHSMGGAVSQSSGSLLVENSRFTRNTATGEIYQSPGPAFPPSTHRFQGRGGAIHVSAGSARILDSIFEENRVTSGNPSEGGAIYFTGGDLFISGSVLSRNSADITPRGGAIYMGAGNLVLTNSTLAENTLQAAGPDARNGLEGAAFGGALFNAGTALVRNSAFLTNRAAGGVGGGAFGAPAPPAAGGGIYNFGTIGIDNSTFSGNSAFSQLIFSGSLSEAPGFSSDFHSSGKGGATNCTFAWGTNAMVMVQGDASTNLVLKNCLLVDHGGEITAINVSDAGNNVTTGGGSFDAASSRTNVNARTGPLGYYGGSTLVYPLLDGSPAIDTADDAAAPAIDQRGRGRPYGPHSDVGAFESSAPFYIWGRIQGFHDQSTTLALGTNIFAAGANGNFSLGAVPAGTNQITLTATNALFLPNPAVLVAVVDGEWNDITSFELHSLTYFGTLEAPAFVLAGSPGERWKIESSTDLQSWTEVGVYSLDNSGLVTIPVANAKTLFLRATPQN